MAVKLRKRKLSDGRVSLWLDVYTSGKRRCESLNLFLGSDKQQNKEVLKVAREVQAKKEFELQSERYSFRGIKKNSSFIKYAEEYYTKKYSHPPTLSNFKNTFKHLAEFAGPNITFEALTPTFCENFKNYLLEVMSPNGAYVYFAKFKVIINQALKEDILTKKPTIGISIQGKETPPKYLTVEEVRLLASTPCGNESVKNAFLFACFTGLRYCDIAQLKHEHIVNHTIQLTQKKTGRVVSVPLAPIAEALIEKERNTAKRKRVKRTFEQGEIFKVPTQMVMNASVARWAREAGISKNISFHWARHTFATMALTYGVDIYTVSKLLGHTKVETTAVYARLLDSKKQEAVRMLPVIGV